MRGDECEVDRHREYRCTCSPDTLGEHGSSSASHTVVGAEHRSTGTSYAVDEHRGSCAAYAVDKYGRTCAPDALDLSVGTPP